MSELPGIRPIGGVAASDVLRDGDWHVTVWLADDLALLTDALGSEEISLVAIESGVGSVDAEMVPVAYGVDSTVERRGSQTAGNHDD